MQRREDKTRAAKKNISSPYHKEKISSPLQSPTNRSPLMLHSTSSFYNQNKSDKSKSSPAPTTFPTTQFPVFDVNPFPYWHTFPPLAFSHYIMFFMSGLMNSSLLPQAPPSMNECRFFSNPPFGEFSLNAHKKLFASLKCGPAVAIS